MIKKIGDFIPDSPYFLAPMAGFTDISYRTICKEMGASLTYTEMVSAKGLYYGDRKSPELLKIGPDEGAVGYQLFGSEPDIMAWATEKLNDHPNVIVDVNMGCPVPKIVKNGEGSALLREPELIYRIIKAMKEATDKPITVKMRIGIEGMAPEGYVTAAKAADEAGVSAVAVHGRTREQYYSGEVNLDAIKQVKEAISVPVIGNGDITSYEDAERMMDYTGCDFVMIGRGAVGDPWVFKRLLREPVNVDMEELKSTIISHYKSLERWKGEYSAVREIRKFISKYLKGIPNSMSVRRSVNSIESGEEFCLLIEKALGQR